MMMGTYVQCIYSTFLSFAVDFGSGTVECRIG